MKDRLWKIIAFLLLIIFMADLAKSRAADPDCPYGNDEPFYPTCDFRLALQDNYADFDVTLYGLSNEALSISGSWLHAGKLKDCDENINRDQCVQIFLDYDENQVKNRFQTYLDKNPFLTTTSETLILDMEPEGIHPRHLSDYEGVYFSDNPNMDVRDRAILAFAMRIRIARELMPKAKLTMFGIGVFSADGNNNSTDDKRLSSYQRGGQLGLYDDLDIISPVLYFRYGPSDFPDPEKLKQTMVNFTKNTIERSQQLTNKNGGAVPLAPILNNGVMGGTKSPDEGKPLEVSVAKAQLETMKAYNSIASVLYWSSLDWPTYADIPSYMKNVKPVPAFCFCSHLPDNKDENRGDFGLFPCMDPKNPSHRENVPICYETNRDAYIVLSIFTPEGRLVRKLIDQQVSEGRHSQMWDRRNDRGEVVASGVYMLLMESNGRKKTGKLVVIK